jgi:hypothetical protein
VWSPINGQLQTTGPLQWKLELPIVLICDIRKDKLVKIREYFDLQTVTEPGNPHKLYS